MESDFHSQKFILITPNFSLRIFFQSNHLTKSPTPQTPGGSAEGAPGGQTGAPDAAGGAAMMERLEQSKKEQAVKAKQEEVSICVLIKMLDSYFLLCQPVFYCYCF